MNNYTLWPHQQEMVNVEYSTRRSFICAGVGTGKTLAALHTMWALNTNAKFNRFIVLVPKTIIPVWEIEAQRFAPWLNVVALNKGNSTAKNTLLHKPTNEPTLYVVNYETAKLLQLDTAKIDAAWADESHNLKSYDSQQSVNLARMMQDIPVRVAQTGTPWEDRPTDAFGQVRWLYPMFGHWQRRAKNGKMVNAQTYASSTVLGHWRDFYEEYVIYRMMDNIKIPIGYKNLDKLAALLNPFTLRIDREAVLELPEVQKITRYAQLTPAQQKVYTQLRNEMIAEIGGHIITPENALVLALRLHQLAGGVHPATGEPMPEWTAKLDVLEQIVDEIAGEPAVIFTRFKGDIQRIEQWAIKNKIGVNVIEGGRNEYKQWITNDRQLVIVNIQAGGAGLNLTKARHAIYYSVGNSKTDYEQSKGRIHRPGARLDKSVIYWRIITDRTADTLLWAALTKKGEIAASLLKEFENAE